MKQKRSELFIGISITIATLIVIVGMLFLERAALFTKGMQLHMVVENAQGIGKGSEIHFRGVRIGTVTDVDVTQDSVVLQLNLEEVKEIPSDSKFEIGSTDLLGGKVVKIKPGNSAEYLSEGARVEGAASGGLVQGLTGFTDELSSQLTGVEGQLTELLKNVNALLGDETHNELLSLLQESRDAAREVELTFAENRGQLQNTLISLRTLSEESREPLTETLEQLERGTENLDGTLSRIRSVSGRLDKLLERIETGKGAVGSVMTEEDLYIRLISSLEELENLVKDVKENPDKYMTIELF